MKRLLLPLLAALALPTAVNAFPWNKNEDIIIKTDLNARSADSKFFFTI